MTLLTDRRQKQAICNAMRGLDPGVNPDDLDDRYYYLYQFIMDYRDAGHSAELIYQDMMRLRLSNDDLKPLIDDILSLEPGIINQYENLDEIGPGLPEIDFLWQDWLPRGYITTLAAWPGVGKTYFALDLARLIIAGQPAPDGSVFNSQTGNVVFVDAEDLLPEVWARAQAWDMDGSKFYPLRRPPRQLLDLSDPVYQADLIDMCHDLKPDLVIVDSFSMIHTGGENTIEDIREILLFLDQLPRAFNLGLMLIHHPRKPPPGLTQPISMHDLRGSGLLLAVTRLIQGLDVLRNGPDDDPNGPRRLKVLKTNFSIYPKPLAVHFAASPRNSRIAELTYSKHDFFAPQPATLTDECARWLRDILADGPKSYRELLELAVEQNPHFNENTLQDARRVLNGEILDTIGPKRRGNMWTLAENGGEVT